MRDSRRANVFPRQPLVLALLLLMAVLLRVAMLLYSNDFSSPPTHEYGLIAANLLSGKGFSGASQTWFGSADEPTALFEPAYPAFLAGLTLLFGGNGYLAAELVQALLSSLVCLFVFQVARRAFDARVAWISAIVTALLPSLIYYPRHLAPRIFAVFFVWLFLACLLEMLANPTRRLRLLTGISAGLAILNAPAILPVIPLVFVWLAFRWRGSGRTLARSAVIAIATLLLLAPWTVRNYVEFHQLVPVRDNFGFNMWAGNHEDADGTSVEEQKQLAAKSISNLAFLTSLNEAERSQELLRVTAEWIYSNPSAFMGLTLERAKYYWWSSADEVLSGGEQNSLFERARDVPFRLLLVGALLGALVAARNGRASAVGLVFVFAAAMSFAYIISTVDHASYRMPVEPALVMLMGYALSRSKTLAGAVVGWHELSGKWRAVSRGRKLAIDCP